jgi:hypothetical protein
VILLIDFYSLLNHVHVSYINNYHLISKFTCIACT